jgi:hypothetical protein
VDIPDFRPYVVEGLKNEAGDVGEIGGGEAVDAAGGDKGPEAGENAIEVAGSLDFAREGSELGEDGAVGEIEAVLFGEATFAVGVEEAEVRMRRGDGHLTMAAVSKRELASDWIGASYGFLRHETPRDGNKKTQDLWGKQLRTGNGDKKAHANNSTAWVTCQ